MVMVELVSVRPWMVVFFVVVSGGGVIGCGVVCPYMVVVDAVV
jgi:hypothetical protein